MVVICNNHPQIWGSLYSFSTNSPPPLTESAHKGKSCLGYVVLSGKPRRTFIHANTTIRHYIARQYFTEKSMWFCNMSACISIPQKTKIELQAFYWDYISQRSEERHKGLKRGRPDRPLNSPKPSLSNIRDCWGKTVLLHYNHFSIDHNNNQWFFVRVTF